MKDYGREFVNSDSLESGQIVFPATQVASAGANTLDDYEEGNFTPAITFGGGNTGITYNTDETKGKYTKIGNRVCYTLRILLTSKGSSAGAALITGLPFTATSDPGHVSAASATFTLITFSGQFTPLLDQGAVVVTLWEVPLTGTRSTIQDTDFVDTSMLHIAGHYAAT